MRSVLILLLLATPALAHGDAHGAAVPALWPTGLDVEPGNRTAFDMDTPLAAGTFVMVHAQHLGSIDGAEAPIRLSLVLDTEAPQVVRAWTVSPGESPTFGLLVQQEGNYSLTAETSGRSVQRLGAYYDLADTPGWKRMPPDLDHGVTVYAWQAPAEGRFQIQAPESQAHEIRVQVIEAKTSAAEWPLGFEVLATSEKGRFSDRYNIDTHTVTWDAVAGKQYYVVLEATESYWPPPSDRQPYDPKAERYVYGPWDLHVVIGPETRESPLPVLPVVLALALAARRR